MKKKWLASILVLTTILSTGAMAAPAYAAEVTPQKTYTMEYGVSVEQAIKDIRNTVDYIKANIKNGSIVETSLVNLSNQLYALDSTIQANGGTATQDVKSLLGDVETLLSKMNSNGATQAKVALAVVKANLGIDEVTVTQARADNSATQQSSSITFTDVKETDWFYTYVMGCAKKGLVSGVGNGQFAPNKTMTRVEFLTVVTRYLYPDAIKNYKGDTSQWWTVYYNVSLEKGLIKDSEFKATDMQVAMTRQEMALVISRALAERGESPETIVSSSAIPDYATIGSYYKDAVRVTYTAGIIGGTDKSGTFSPMGTLTRGQACTVLYRLTEPQSRSPLTGTEQNTQTDVKDHGTQPDKVTIGSGGPTGGSAYHDNRFEQGQGTQTFKEGDSHYAPHVGDIVIKADGTRVVLESTVINGTEILGWGANGPQGVDPYTGYGVNKVGVLSYFDASSLLKDPMTGSVFSSREWDAIRATQAPTTQGKKDGEISSNKWFRWSNTLQEWVWTGPSIANPNGDNNSIGTSFDDPINWI